MMIDNMQYYIYGDVTYIIRAWMQKAFPHLSAMVDQEAFNKSMAALRESMECIYK